MWSRNTCKQVSVHVNSIAPFAALVLCPAPFNTHHTPWKPCCFLWRSWHLVDLRPFLLSCAWRVVASKSDISVQCCGRLSVCWVINNMCVCVLRILRACYSPGNLSLFHFIDPVVFGEYSNWWSLWLRQLHCRLKFEYLSYYIWHPIISKLRTKSHTHANIHKHTHKSYTNI